MTLSNFGADEAAIRAFCQRWSVARLWLFGSLVAGDARAHSDADVLVEFRSDAATSTWDWPAMEDELREIFHREIDLLSTGVLRNPLRRTSILASRRLLYAA
ncbi:MAG: nucleotidyltransferase domain-containing protein [Phycisphaerales bacterium]